MYYLEQYRARKVIGTRVFFPEERDLRFLSVFFCSAFPLHLFARGRAAESGSCVWGGGCGGGGEKAVKVRQSEIGV